LRDHLEETLLLIRNAKVATAFKSFNAYSHIVELTAKVCKQNEGWLKSLNAKTANKANKSAGMS
jgi:hypothetical protein